MIFSEFNATLSDEELIPLISNWKINGHDVVLSFVVDTWGSSPRKVGSLMAVRDDKLVVGSVSGGCVEGVVIETALNLIKEPGFCRLNFGVSDEDAWEVGLSCGGRISIWLCSVNNKYFPDELLTEILERISNRQTIELQCDLITGKVEILHSKSNISFLKGSKFTYIQLPRAQLFLIGAVHISQHLAIMARQVGFEVIVIDPRRRFSNEQRFPNFKLINQWPDEALGNYKLDANTAIITLTHDPKIDDLALISALKNTPFLIASLGSKKTHAARLARLAKLGFSSEQTTHISGPAGCAINAKTPSEIAVSILAELIHAYRSKTESQTN